MSHAGYQILWIFFAYSFLGWVFETGFAAAKQKRFVNRGLINGPFCVVYGIAAAVMSVGLNDLGGIWLFLGAMIWGTVIEWTAGHLIEHFYHERWWDYSNIKRNLDGYICLPVSLLWGALGFIAVKWGNTLLVTAFRLIPELLGIIILWVLVGMLAVDILADYFLFTGKSGKLERWEAANNGLANISARLGKWIAKNVEKRISKAYPKAVKSVKVKEKSTVFAEGCGFYKVVMLFILGAFLGDITETIYCRVTAGVWMSRSSVVWGPFSIVWGLAIAAVTAMLYKYKDKGDGFLFCVGTFLGGAYEYLCSVFTEIVFGKVFWDYSALPFNLGGRINLLYCFFWGIAAVIWFKKLYPFMAKMIEKLPMKFGKIMTWCLVAFMSANVCVSCLALIRYDQRGEEIPATESWQVWVDETYDDARMEQIYPNAKKA